MCCIRHRVLDPVLMFSARCQTTQPIACDGEHFTFPRQTVIRMVCALHEMHPAARCVRAPARETGERFLGCGGRGAVHQPAREPFHFSKRFRANSANPAAVTGESPQRSYLPRHPHPPTLCRWTSYRERPANDFGSRSGSHQFARVISPA
jgi:hypothetical protein